MRDILAVFFFFFNYQNTGINFMLRCAVVVDFIALLFYKISVGNTNSMSAF